MKNLIERIEARLDDWGAKLEKKNIEYPVDLICGILFLVIGIVLLLIMPQQVQISEKRRCEWPRFPDDADLAHAGHERPSGGPRGIQHGDAPPDQN